MNRYISLLDQYLDNVQLFLTQHIVLAPLLLLLAEETGLPILVPGDAILGYVGYSLSKTHSASLWEAFILALFAVVVGASILFWIAKRWGQAVLKKGSRFIFLQEKHLVHAESLFERYGIWAIIFGRHIPGLRIPITIFAATSGVRYRTFIFGTIVSTAAWILFYLSIGKRYGNDIQATVHTYAWLSLGLFLIIILTIIVLHIIGRHRQSVSD